MFVFTIKYKKYYSAKATIVNLICSYFATIAIWGGAATILLYLLDMDMPSESILWGIIVLIGGLTLRYYKDQLTDRIALQSDIPTDMPRAPQQPLPPTTPAVPEPKAEEKPKGKFCTQCGEKNPHDARFCVKCGHPF